MKIYRIGGSEGFLNEVSDLSGDGIEIRVSATDNPNMVILDHIEIDEEMRHQGLGKSIMQDMLYLADKHGVAILLVSVVGLGDFYRKLGFKSFRADMSDFMVYWPKK